MTRQERYIEYCRRREELIQQAKEEKWGAHDTYRAIEGLAKEMWGE